MASEWPVVSLGEAINLKRGYDLAARDRKPGAIPIISSSGASGSHSRAMVQSPGVVTGRYGTIGLVHYVETPFWPLNTTLYVQNFKGNEPRFVYYLLKTISYRDYLDKAAVPGINRNDVHRARVSLPPLAEQKEIASILALLDRRIALLQLDNATLESIARAVFKSWFVDFDPVRVKAEGREPEGMDAATAALFPSELAHYNGNLVPTGWFRSTLGQIANVTDCLHSKKPERIATGKAFFQLANIRADGLMDLSEMYFISDTDYQKWISRMEASPGDCVITNVGRVGAVAQVPSKCFGALGRNMTGLRCKTDFPFPTFLIQLLTSSMMRNEIENKTDSGTILESLNVRSIPHLRFVRPAQSVVKRFEELCRPLRARMETNLECSRSLADLRDTLLPRLISGKLRVPEAEKMLEAVL